MAKLKIGDPAPDFTLSTQTGETVSLREALRTGPVVLIFYPMNKTPGCTAQLCAARESHADYTAAGVQVYGVNGADARSHQRFVDAYNLTTPLLVDKGLAVASLYDATLGFAPFKLINRTVVGVDRSGAIAFYERGTPSSKAILEAVAGTPA